MINDFLAAKNKKHTNKQKENKKQIVHLLAKINGNFLFL